MAKTTRTPFKDLRTMPEADLRAQLTQLRQELWQSRVKVRDGALQQTHHLPAIRRQIARVHTVLTERARSAPAASKA